MVMPNCLHEKIKPVQLAQREVYQCEACMALLNADRTPYTIEVQRGRQPK